MTEDQLREANGLVAYVHRLEAEALRTRSQTRGDELFTKIDGLRWRLDRMYGVQITPFKKLGPDGKATA